MIKNLNKKQQESYGSEILQKFGFSNQESEIFDNALGSDNRQMKNRGFPETDQPYQTF